MNNQNDEWLDKLQQERNEATEKLFKNVDSWNRKTITVGKIALISVVLIAISFFTTVICLLS